MTLKIVLALCFITSFSLAQVPLQPGVYPLMDIKTGSLTLLSGSTLHLTSLTIVATEIRPGQSLKIQTGRTEENLVFVLSESLTISLKDSTYVLGKGSVAMILPSENYSLTNNGDKVCVYQVMKYQSQNPIDAARGKAAGGSFIKDWNKLLFKPHERGGVRSYFDRPTALTKRFEMHVTSLNEGLTSHAPHTHRAEEFILVLDGNVEMLIGEKSFKAKAGDVLFAPSNVLHGLKNDGKGMCSYFAFQWESF
jgi:(S)-ureidoglycine aminohydrolase